MARPITLARPRLQKVGKVGLENQRLALRQAAECALSHVGAKLQQPSNAKVALRARGSPPNEARCMGFAGHKMYQTARMIDTLRQKAFDHDVLQADVLHEMCCKPGRAKAGRGQEASFGKVGQEKGANTQTVKCKGPPAGQAYAAGKGTSVEQSPRSLPLAIFLLLCPTRGARSKPRKHRLVGPKCGMSTEVMVWELSCSPLSSVNWHVDCP